MGPCGYFERKVMKEIKNTSRKARLSGGKNFKSRVCSRT